MADLDPDVSADARTSGRCGSLFSLFTLAHHPTRVFTSLSHAARLSVAAHINSDRGIRVSKAAREVPRSGGGCAVPGPPISGPRRAAAAALSAGRPVTKARPGRKGATRTATRPQRVTRTATRPQRAIRATAPGQAWPLCGRFTRRGDVGTSHPSGPQGAVIPPVCVPEHPISPVRRPCFGRRPALNEGFRGHRRVAGWLRRVVVARRCMQHHLQRVMVETPPRAGPSPPHGPARFSLPAGRLEPSAGTVPSALVGGPRPQRG